MALGSWDISAEGMHLLDAALRLPQREREILAERLHASVDTADLAPEWHQAWTEELDKRDAELDSGKVAAVSLEDVRQAMQETRHGKMGT